MLGTVKWCDALSWGHTGHSTPVHIMGHQVQKLKKNCFTLDSYLFHLFVVYQSTASHQMLPALYQAVLPQQSMQVSFTMTLTTQRPPFQLFFFPPWVHPLPPQLPICTKMGWNSAGIISLFSLHWRLFMVSLIAIIRWNVRLCT